MQHPAAAYEEALRQLSRCSVDERQSLARIFAEATRLVARTLRVERVGVWLFEDGGQALGCECQYECSTDSHSEKASLRLADCPAYGAALQEHRAIAADDARTDPRTRELTASYLEPAGITSMLDAPLLRQGEVIGVVCHEHVGPPRVWSEDEVRFASSVADIVALGMEQAACLEARRALEEQTRRYQEERRMASLGRVAAAVAHDFNKLMTIVLAKAQSIATAPDLPTAVAEDARVMADAVRRSGALTRQLAELGSAPREVPNPIKVDAVVGAAGDLLRATARGGQRIEISLGAGDAAVRIDRVRLDQTLVNLVSNAVDVTGEGDEITVATTVRVGSDGTWVLLQVTDDGPGIDQATRPHIFEPYFTTKGERGCGLGLAIVHAVVQRAGGFVTVDSAPGRGTTFTVHLPVAQDVSSGRS